MTPLLILLLLSAPAPGELEVPPLEGSDAIPAQPKSIACTVGGAGASLQLSGSVDCGGSSAVCIQEQEVTLTRGKVSRFQWRRDRDEGSPRRPGLRFRCAPDRLTVTFESGRSFSLAPAGPDGRLQPDSASMKELGALWDAPADKAEVRTRVHELRQFFEASDLADLTPVWNSVELLEARSDLASEAFGPAEMILDGRPASPRRDALLAELQHRREATQPFLFVEPIRIGSVPAPPPASGDDADPDEQATPRWFWLGNSFCVLQEDGSQTVRCYDVASRKWGRRRPAPQDVATLPFIANVERFTACTADEKVCMSCYDFVAALPHDARLAVSEGKLAVARQKPDSDDYVLTLVTPDQATALIAHSNGTPFFGGARYLFSPSAGGNGAFVANPFDHPETTWHPLPPPPTGSKWTGIDVSPDQSHAVGFAESSTTPGAGALWLFRIVPRG